ncbi:hypothetical protein ACMU_05515 [Actibacterium mucosum KCTC 23349]|uniref:Lipoprotein n=1 Tax=Actibacterium mucosum KCTC 23349 TaxID=1454373 RepID=A0A037ZLM1_9RHOB|nr:hypothetical protein [Actibacterium mucosum]KAJ56402.1 hypothetical protein ACMU_05515 [Actibacterium mucosum KCTC 23349]
MKSVLRCLAGLGLLFLAACSVPPPAEVGRAEIDALASGILALDADIDPDEAARAAEIAFAYTAQLRAEYQITDPPLIHNAKVNAGRRPRGLCWHWAEDMQVRLAAENFETLDLHRAIANAFNPILIDHSTVLISAKGDAFDEGMVLDPWRYGGRLFWAPTLEDKRYTWIERSEVFARKLAAGNLKVRDPSTEAVQ